MASASNLLEINLEKLTAPLPNYCGWTVREWLDGLADDGDRAAYLRFYDAHPNFERAPAGARHHHWWQGGLAQHTAEVIALATAFHARCDRDIGDMVDVLPAEQALALAQARPTADDVVIAGFLHDFPKVWLYRELHYEEWKAKGSPIQQFEFTAEAIGMVGPEDKLLLELGRFGITPTEKQWGAVLFHEGGWSQRHFGWQGKTATSETAYRDNPLAVIIHMADIYSGFILGRGIA